MTDLVLHVTSGRFLTALVTGAGRLEYGAICAGQAAEQILRAEPRCWVFRGILIKELSLHFLPSLSAPPRPRAEMANEIKLIAGSGHPELGTLMASRYVQPHPSSTLERKRNRAGNISAVDRHFAVGAMGHWANRLQTRDAGRQHNSCQIFQPGNEHLHRRVSSRRRCFHPPVHRAWGGQRRADGAHDPHQRLPQRVGATHHRGPAQLSLQQTRQEGQVPRPYQREAYGQHAASIWLCKNFGPSLTHIELLF